MAVHPAIYRQIDCPDGSIALAWKRRVRGERVSSSKPA